MPLFLHLPISFPEFFPRDGNFSQKMLPLQVKSVLLKNFIFIRQKDKAAYLLLSKFGAVHILSTVGLNMYETLKEKMLEQAKHIFDTFEYF